MKKHTGFKFIVLLFAVFLTAACAQQNASHDLATATADNVSMIKLNLANLTKASHSVAKQRADNIGTLAQVAAEQAAWLEREMAIEAKIGNRSQKSLLDEIKTLSAQVAMREQEVANTADETRSAVLNAYSAFKVPINELKKVEEALRALGKPADRLKNLNALMSFTTRVAEEVQKAKEEAEKSASKAKGSGN